MNTYAVYFKPLGGLATWPLASDTLFGAVCWGIRALGLMDDEHLTDWLEKQKADPAFGFSHAFPFYAKGNTRVRLYPRPANFQPSFADFDVLAKTKAEKASVVVAGKKFKRLNYVSEDILNQIAAGSLLPGAGLQAILSGSGQIVQKADALCTMSEASALPDRLFEREPMQHNQIDRMSGGTVEGMLFYRQETFFAPNAGLWALLRADEQDLIRYIQPALRYLADTGLGADRTSGKGQFEISVEIAPVLPHAKTPNAMMTLSHYLPGVDELDTLGEPLSYTLKILRPKREQKHPRLLSDGQKSAQIYKQAMRVFEPGSVFPLKTRKELYGRLARLTPLEQEAVFQSGAALMIYL